MMNQSGKISQKVLPAKLNLHAVILIRLTLTGVRRLWCIASRNKGFTVERGRCRICGILDSI
jgi:hypothetical protein